MWHLARIGQRTLYASRGLCAPTLACAPLHALTGLGSTTRSRSSYFTINRKPIKPHSSIYIPSLQYCTAQNNQADPRREKFTARAAREVSNYFQKTAERAKASEGVFGYIVARAPAPLQPYLRLLRLEKPIGVWLLYWPCTWGITLAMGPSLSQIETIPPYLYMLALFLAGAVLARGAGCIINDMWDRNFDRLVARTKTRPLASGEVSLRGASIALALTGLASLAVLLQLPANAILVGLLSAPLVIVYPTVKRVSHWPQLVLGLAFNWGVLLGWSAALVEPLSLNELVRTLTPVIWPYVAGVAWTLIYDTIYAHQDTQDDARIGVKSTALRFGAASKTWFAGFAALMLSTLAVTGLVHDLAPIYYCALLPVAAHLYWQIRTLDLHQGHDCAVKFRSNHFTGMMIWLALLLGVLY